MCAGRPPPTVARAPPPRRARAGQLGRRPGTGACHQRVADRLAGAMVAGGGGGEGLEFELCIWGDLRWNIPFDARTACERQCSAAAGQARERSALFAGRGRRVGSAPRRESAVGKELAAGRSIDCIVRQRMGSAQLMRLAQVMRPALSSCDGRGSCGRCGSGGRRSTCGRRSGCGICAAPSAGAHLAEVGSRHERRVPDERRPRRWPTSASRKRRWAASRPVAASLSRAMAGWPTEPGGGAERIASGRAGSECGEPGGR